jgi:streptogramin lyase
VIAMPEFAPGDVFVGHRIEGLAGRGGMGVVYRATQLDLDRLVALKVIAPALAEEPDFRARFVAESKAAASIEHPNVLPVYYAGEREGVLFIVMRYVDGPDLRSLVRANERLDPERAAQIVAQVGAALDAAHARGLVHRDVKPANVLLGPDDHAYLTDFGLTKRVDASVDPSHSGGWVGTLGYVAPEQIRGERIDARTDVYALGCVLVHALTGSAPFARGSDEATLWAHLNAPPPTDAVPPEFQGVVARALAKDLSDRYPSTGDLGRAALAAAGRSGVAAPERMVARGAAAPPETATPARPPAGDDDETAIPSPPADGRSTMPATRTRGGRERRRRWIAVAAVLALIVGAGGLVLLKDEGSSGARGRTATTAGTVSAEPLRPSVTRPNSLAFSGDSLVVLSARTGDLDFVDASTGAPRARTNVGRGASAVAAGFGSLWVSKFRTRSLVRIDPDTRDRSGAAIALPSSGAPVAVDTGEGAVWVATHEDGGVDKVIKIAPRGAVTRQIAVSGGVQDLAVGGGAVWVSNRVGRTITRIDVRTAAQREIRVGREPQGLAVGEGAVWVAVSKDDTVMRVGLKTLTTRPVRLTFPPARVAVGGGSVWVTARTAASLIRIDPRRRRIRATIPTGHGPFAVGVYRKRSVWFTVVEDNAIQRVKL